MERYARITQLELDATEQLVAALYASMADAPLFKRLSLLYFAVASYSEAARRLGRPGLAPGFLLHAHPTFGPELQACAAAGADRAAGHRARWPPGSNRPRHRAVRHGRPAGSHATRLVSGAARGSPGSGRQARSDGRRGSAAARTLRFREPGQPASSSSSADGPTRTGRRTARRSTSFSRSSISTNATTNTTTHLAPLRADGRLRVGHHEEDEELIHRAGDRRELASQGLPVIGAAHEREHDERRDVGGADVQPADAPHDDEAEQPDHGHRPEVVAPLDAEQRHGLRRQEQHRAHAEVRRVPEVPAVRAAARTSTGSRSGSRRSTATGTATGPGCRR